MPCDAILPIGMDFVTETLDANISICFQIHVAGTGQMKSEMRFQLLL